MRLAMLAVLVSTATAGVISGIVLENATGFPLARARIKLQVVTSAGVSTHAMQMSGRTGQFVFPSVPDGLYVLSVSKDNFQEAAYGQRRHEGYGTGIAVAKDSNFFTELRLLRLGAISGRVFDENRVGLPGIRVLAYPARLPLRSVASATSDDRGAYRVFGLPPGKYWIRTASASLEDATGLLPTFGPSTPLTREGRTVETRFDNDTPDMDVTPLAGSLHTMLGQVTCGEPHPVKVTLSTDTGRREATISCMGRFTFDGIGPGPYEVLAHIQQSGSAAFQEGQITRDINVTLQLREPPEVRIDMPQRAADSSQVPVTLLARRKDLAGVGETLTIRGRTYKFTPGYWEFAAAMPVTHYLASVTSRYQGDSRVSQAGPSPDWFDALIQQIPYWPLTVTVASGAGSITGRVTASGTAMPGAPVFLWPVAPAVRRSIHGPKIAYANIDGQYLFEGLAPGEYRLMSSFDYREVNEAVLEEARAVSVSLRDSQQAASDLTLYQAP